MTTLSHLAPRLLFAAAAALALAGCLSEAKKAEPLKQDRPVLVEKVAYAPLHAARTLAATVKPRIESDLGFRVSGKVSRRLVDMGQTVTKGAVLAILDDTDFNLQREQAEAEKRAATTALAQAEAEMNRVETLRKQGWSTDAVRERQQTALGEARSRLDRATKALELSRNASTYARLVADADGVVTQTLVEPGQVVAAGQAVVRIARLEEKDAVVAVPEAIIERVRTGAASMTLWSKPDRKYTVKLRDLAPTADPATRTYQARFAIEGAGPEVLLGMSATVTITDAAGETVARLPLSAVADSGKGPGLFVVDVPTGTLAWKPIEIAGYDGRDVLVRKGVAEGETVVILGVQKLDPGQKVRVVERLEF